MIKILTDSSSDMPLHMAADLGIAVLPVRIRLGTAVHHDGEDIGRSDFYRHLAKGGSWPTVEPPSHEEFHDAYSRLLKSTDQILSIHVSSKLSRTVQVAQEAAKGFLGRSKITVVDSRMISWGLQLLATSAGEAAKRGASIEQIVRLIRGIIPHIYMVFFDGAVHQGCTEYGGIEREAVQVDELLIAVGTSIEFRVKSSFDLGG